MIAYFVHDNQSDTDLIYLPERRCLVPVDRARLETFIAVRPDFSSFAGETCEALAPERFCGVIATRRVPGDVTVHNHELWRERMFYHLGAPPEPPRGDT